MSKNNREFYWCLVELPNGKKEWYCISRVLREAINWEREQNQNRFWKKTLIGNYINLSVSPYQHDHAQLSVGKICKIRIRHQGAKDWHWTRNQFVTPAELMNFKQAYNYLKHDYRWYNRWAIKLALRYWQNELCQHQVKSLRKKIHKFRQHLI